MDAPRYTIDQLVEATGIPRRTIRFYVQEGLLAPPAGRGRGGFYNDSHLARLRQIRADRERGLGLDAIRSRTSQAEVAEPAGGQRYWMRYEMVPGVELHVSSDAQRRYGERLRYLLRAAKSLIREGTDESTRGE